MGFEPTRAEPIGLAVQRLNHSATSSMIMISLDYFQSRHDINKKKKKKKKPQYCINRVKRFPTPGVEPGPPGWKPDILAVRPRGIMFPSGIEPETFCVLGRCDNRYTTETCYIE